MAASVFGCACSAFKHALPRPIGELANAAKRIGPDAAGQAYWVGQLQTGASTVGGAILNIIEGAQGSDALTISHKVTVGTYYDTQVFSHNVQFSVASARAALGAVSSDPSNVAAAQAIVDAYVRSAPAAAPASSESDVSVVGISTAHDLALVA